MATLTPAQEPAGWGPSPPLQAERWRRPRPGLWGKNGEHARGARWGPSLGRHSPLHICRQQDGGPSQAPGPALRGPVHKHTQS